MQRENLVGCEAGDWVAMMDAEELQPEENSFVQSWESPAGEQWLFRLTELEIEGGTLFGWVREA